MTHRSTPPLGLLSPTDVLLANPGVVTCERLAGGSVLFLPSTGEALAVSGVGLEVWRALDGVRTVEQIAERLAREYEVPHAAVLHDTLEFLAPLRSKLFVLRPQERAGVTARLPRPPSQILPEGPTPTSPEPGGGERAVLALADGTRLIVRAEDGHASRVVALLGSALGRAPVPTGGSEAELRVATRPFTSPGQGTCVIDPPSALRAGRRVIRPDGTFELPYHPVEPGQWLWRQAARLIAAVADHAQEGGGVLLHAALAAVPREALPTRPGSGGGNGPPGAKGMAGVLLAAPSGVGKTTASRRLAAPWVSLCDDSALVVRDRDGVYWAHPLPTWSHLLRDGGVTHWDVHAAVPLTAVFVLRQSPRDRAAPVAPAVAVGDLMRRAREPVAAFKKELDPADESAFNLRLFDNLCNLLEAVPTYLLEASREGAFWNEMARALAGRGRGPRVRDAGQIRPVHR